MLAASVPRPKSFHQSWSRNILDSVRSPFGGAPRMSSAIDSDPAPRMGKHVRVDDVPEELLWVVDVPGEHVRIEGVRGKHVRVEDVVDSAEEDPSTEPSAPGRGSSVMGDALAPEPPRQQLGLPDAQLGAAGSGRVRVLDHQCTPLLRH